MNIIPHEDLDARVSTRVPHEDLGRYDVLKGRGGNNFTHTGNNLVKACSWVWKQAYKGLSRREKTQLSWKIVKYIHSLGGRFLEPEDSGGWFVVTDRSAREKVAQCLRDASNGKNPPVLTASLSLTARNEEAKQDLPSPGPSLVQLLQSLVLSKTNEAPLGENLEPIGLRTANRLDPTDLASIAELLNGSLMMDWEYAV